MTREEFIERYGGVYEHSAWVAERVFDEVGAVAGEELNTLLQECVDNASRDERLALIRAHPDLAGKAAVAGELTADSTSEQTSAGIDQCSPEEFEKFTEFNDAYKARFDFPFVMAVKNSNRKAILEAFEQRLKNSTEEEFETAIAEIHKIAALRLEALA